MKNPIETLITIIWIVACTHLLILHYNRERAKTEAIIEEAMEQFNYQPVVLDTSAIDYITKQN